MSGLLLMHCLCKQHRWLPSPCSDTTLGLATSSSWQSSFLCQSSPHSSVEQQHEVSGAGMLTQLSLGHAPGGHRKRVSHLHNFNLLSLPWFGRIQTHARSFWAEFRLPMALLLIPLAHQPDKGAPLEHQDCGSIYMP